MAIVNPVITVLVALAAVFLRARSSARTLGLTMEAIGAVGAFVSVITGFHQAIAAIAVAIVVVVLIQRGRLVEPGGRTAGTTRNRPDGPTGQQIEKGVVAVATVIGLVPIVPRSAGGPARRTTSPF